MKPTEDYFYATAAKLLASALKEQERPFRWLAKKTGISPSEIIRILKGDSSYAFSSFVLCCIALDLDPVRAFETVMRYSGWIKLTRGTLNFLVQAEECEGLSLEEVISHPSVQKAFSSNSL